MIGNGVVLDPWALKAEIERLEGRACRSRPTTSSSPTTAALILPIHSELDVMREAAAGKGKIGTTGRGIGPAYEDKVGRRAVRVCDLATCTSSSRCSTASARTTTRCAPASASRRSTARAAREAAGHRPFVGQYAQPVWMRLREERKKGSRILFEGAQGVLLDVDHGTYPFVTSSNTVSGTVASGSGLGPARPASCSASSRPTPPGSARARSRPSSAMRSASGSASAATSSAPSPGASAAAAGSTRCWCASPARSAG
jgi:adenylosuccinate synthase